MFLKKFTLKSHTGETIREVIFKKGINLIIGETGNDISGSSNNLGKTTLIRCIDFCLGGKNADELYKDREFKTPNETVEAFLKKYKPTFVLELSNQYEEPISLVIERTLDINHKHRKINNFINKELLNLTKFQEVLKQELFGFSDDRPTLRQLIGKFIRKKDEQISSILYFNGNYCNSSDYEKIHLFLMGFNSTNLLAKKSYLEDDLKKTENAIKIFESRHSESSLNQRRYLFEEELKDLKAQADNFQITEKYDEEADRLAQTQLQINKFDQELAQLHLKINIAEDRLEKLQQSTTDLDGSAIQYVYEEAKYYNDKLLRSFDEMVAFHNTMLNNEMQFLRENIDQDKERIDCIYKERESLSKEYNQLLAFLGKTGSLAEYTKLNDKISEKSEEMGKIQGLLDDLLELQEHLLKVQEDHATVMKDVSSQISQLDERLKIFNKYFSQYTEQLSGEKYLLSYKPEGNIYKFKIDDMHGNPGTGKKQSIVIAFDLAYTDFCNETGLKRPSFVTQDKIEVIDIDKLNILFSLANNQNGQLIIPVIFDKVKDLSDLTENTVLTLTQEDKFFRIQ